MGAYDEYQADTLNANTRDYKRVLRHPSREQAQSGQHNRPAREKKQKAGNLHGKRAHPAGNSNARLKYWRYMTTTLMPRAPSKGGSR
jgi:hypothetical protein